MPVPVSTLTDVKSRVSALKRRMEARKAEMLELDPWRHLTVDDVTTSIWRNYPENARRRTIMRPHIASTTDTVVAFLSGKRPTITVTAKNSTSLIQTNRANVNERIGAALFDTMDRDRDVPLIAETAEYDVHRGEIIGMALWLNPEERGEKRYDPEDDDDFDPLDPLTYEPQVIDPGKFPLVMHIFDPADCAWAVGSDGRTIEFVREYKATFLELCDTWPDLHDHKDFKTYYTPSQADSALLVTDYWNETHNAIIINNVLFKKPTEHGYPRLPVVIELAKPRVIRNGTDVVRREGTPFCQPMLGAIADSSWADSMLASHLEETAIATLVHEGLTDESPYMQRDETTGEPQYTAVVDLSTGARIMPTFNNERFKYLEPPQVSGPYQDFRMSRVSDMSLVSFPESILSGAQTADVSGYAYSQMKQAALARVEPYRMALDRFWSRMLTLTNEIIVANWDYLADNPLTLATIVGDASDAEEQLAVTVEDFESIGSIRVVIHPEVPINKEQEEGLVFQKVSLGLLSKLAAMDKLGDVQDPVADIERMAFESFAMSDPATMAALAKNYMRKNGLTEQQPVPPPQPPPMDPSMMGAPPMDPAMMDPSMMGAAPPVDPMAAGAAPPMDPAMLMQMMAGG